MSWMNCQICGKFKYVPDMVKFTSSFSGISLVICSTCLEVAEVKKGKAVFWLPEVTYEDVAGKGESVDSKRDLALPDNCVLAPIPVELLQKLEEGNKEKTPKFLLISSFGRYDTMYEVFPSVEATEGIVTWAKTIDTFEKVELYELIREYGETE